MKAYRLLLLTVLLFIPSGTLFAQKNFGFDNRKASGQPYISAAESVKRFKVPPGWEVTVFAAEPEVINPIAFSIDERGRLWVLECFEYPSRTPKGKKPRDRIKILEDTKGTGKADKVTTWADGPRSADWLGLGQRPRSRPRRRLSRSAALSILSERPQCHGPLRQAGDSTQGLRQRRHARNAQHVSMGPG